MIKIEYLFSGQPSTVCIVFTIIVIGYFLGKIKFCGISLDLSGVLIVAMIYGLLVRPESESFLQNMKFLTSLGTSLFISVIGITSGYGLSKCIKRKVVLCFFISLSAILIDLIAMITMLKLDVNISSETMCGILCGALTSTPGLSTLCEVSESFATAASAAYGCSYIFGVIGVVLFVQILSKNHNSKIAITKPINTSEQTMPSIKELILISTVIIAGNSMGCIKLPFIRTSLGNSCGVLCAGLICGWLLSKKYTNLNFTPNQIETIRELGLMLFLVGTGVPAGVELLSVFSISTLIYGIVLTLIPMIISFLISNKFLKNDLSTSLCIVAGVMTSTPAIGVLYRNEKCYSDTTVYSVTYTIALILIIIFMRIISFI